MTANKDAYQQTLFFRISFHICILFLIALNIPMVTAFQYVACQILPHRTSYAHML